ncbi:MAG: YerC/YecD family TrpR-related protein [Candidatus Beckwithbacteria bacterium]
MPQVSKYQLSKQVEEEIKSVFAETLSLLSTREDIFAFFDDFLTPTERIMLSKRISIAMMLKKGYNYEIIKDILKVSQATIASVNLKLKYTGKGYHQILNRIISQQKINKAFDKIENFILDNLSRGRGKGSSFWQELKRKKQSQKSSMI